MNQLFGTIIIIICLTGYFFSWKFQLKENYKMALGLLILCGLLLRIYTSCDFFLHSWDERYHALVAKNLMKHMLVPTLYDNPLISYDYTNWKTNYIWLHKQPLPLWTMALSMMLFGVNEIAVRIPSIVLTTIGIGLTFSIAKYFFNSKVAYLSAFFYSINGLIIEMTGGRVATDHIDVFFLFFIELAVFFTIIFIQKRNYYYNVFAGLCIGAAILCKWLPALIVLPVWLLLIIDSNNFQKGAIIKDFVILLIVAIGVFLPWQVYIYHRFPLEAGWEASFNIKHVTEVLDGMEGSICYYIDQIRINYGELIYLPLIWFLWKLFKDYKDYKKWAICIWFLIPLIFFSCIKTKMQGYVLFISPALFIISAWFWCELLVYRLDHKLKWLMNLIIVAMIILPLRYTIERTKVFLNRDRNPEWAQELKALSKKNINKGVLLNYPRPVEAMFYTNLIVYEPMPEKSFVNFLINNGYTVIINDNGSLPEDLYSLKGVSFQKFASSEIGKEQ